MFSGSWQWYFTIWFEFPVHTLLGLRAICKLDQCGASLPPTTAGHGASYRIIICVWPSPQSPVSSDRKRRV